MISISRILSAGVFTIGLLLPVGLFAETNDTAIMPEAKTAEVVEDQDTVAAPAEKPKRELSPALVGLRDMVRQTLAVHRRQTPNTQANTATEIMSYCLAFGCGSQALLNGSNGQRINGITCLCWNYPCAGFELLGFSRDHIAPRIGYGYQERPGEFLATLALARVKSDYPVRVGKDTRTVADLIEAEKLACRSGGDMSLRLIGLSYYVDEPEWKNDLDETWSIDRIIKEEMAKPVVSAAEVGLDRLVGLSYAVTRREKRSKPIEGQYRRAKKYTTDFQEYALKLQNTDGSWGPTFLATRSTSPDVQSQLRATGRVLRWLAISLQDEKLEDARVVKAVGHVARLLSSRQYRRNTPSLSTQQIVSVGHALHGLNVYDRRVFKPADPVEEKAAATAKRKTDVSKSR